MLSDFDYNIFRNEFDINICQLYEKPNLKFPHHTYLQWKLTSLKT
jgi:hypothetical protein